MSAPGWYPDPGRPGQQRYYDGRIWTDHRASTPPPPPPKQPASTKKVLIVVGALVAAILIISLSSKDDSKPTATSPATTYTKTVTPTSAPDATDRLFITTLRNEGIPVRSEDDAVLKARALCLTFDKHPGTSIEEATLGFITKVETTFTPQQGAFFIGAAVAGYCPEHRTW